MDDFIAFDDAHQSLLHVKATPLIDFITAPLEPVPRDPILAPVVQLLEEGLSYSAGIGSPVEEAQSVSIFVNEEPSESDSMSIPSILTVTASNGSINEEQQAVSIIITDLKPETLVEEQQQADSISMEVKEMDAPDPVAVVAVEDAEQSHPDLDCTVQEVQPKMEVPSDCVATSEPIVHEEEEPASDPAASDLIVYEGVDNKLTTRAQLMQEITTSANGELNDPAQALLLLHTDSAHVPEDEEEEDNLKPQLVLEESKTDISEHVNLYEIEEEVPSGREKEVADLVEEHPAPVQSVGAGTGDIREEEVSDPAESSPLLLTLLHFAAVAIEVKLAESASSVAEKEHEKEPMAKDEEQPMESIFEIETKMMDQSFNLHFPTPDQRFVSLL